MSKVGSFLAGLFTDNSKYSDIVYSDRVDYLPNPHLGGPGYKQGIAARNDETGLWDVYKYDGPAGSKASLHSKKAKLVAEDVEGIDVQAAFDEHIYTFKFMQQGISLQPGQLETSIHGSFQRIPAPV